MVKKWKKFYVLEYNSSRKLKGYNTTSYIKKFKKTTAICRLDQEMSRAYAMQNPGWVKVIIIIIIPMTIFIVLSIWRQPYASSFWFTWTKVGQRQVAANSQAKLQTWPLSPPVGCYRPNIRPSPFVLLLNHKVDTHLPSLGGQKAELT